MKILCFGNEFIKEDSLAKEIIKDIRLNNVEFIKCEKNEDLLKYEGNIILLDVVQNLKKTKLLKIGDLKENNLCSCHDFDISTYLQLLKSIGKIRNVKIIGIPQKGNKELIKKDIIRIISREL